jgi:hypothetical protein
MKSFLCGLLFHLGFLIHLEFSVHHLGGHENQPLVRVSVPAGDAYRKYVSNSRWPNLPQTTNRRTAGCPALRAACVFWGRGAEGGRVVASRGLVVPFFLARCQWRKFGGGWHQARRAIWLALQPDAGRWCWVVLKSRMGCRGLAKPGGARSRCEGGGWILRGAGVLRNAVPPIAALSGRCVICCSHRPCKATVGGTWTVAGAGCGKRRGVTLRA